jgi:hypothetical protein
MMVYQISVSSLNKALQKAAQKELERQVSSQDYASATITFDNTDWFTVTYSEDTWIKIDGELAEFVD